MRPEANPTIRALPVWHAQMGLWAPAVHAEQSAKPADSPTPRRPHASSVKQASTVSTVTAASSARRKAHMPWRRKDVSSALQASSQTIKRAAATIARSRVTICTTLMASSASPVPRVHSRLPTGQAVWLARRSGARLCPRPETSAHAVTLVLNQTTTSQSVLLALRCTRMTLHTSAQMDPNVSVVHQDMSPMHREQAVTVVMENIRPMAASV